MQCIPTCSILHCFLINVQLIWYTVFPVISARVLIKFYSNLGARLLDGGRLLKGALILNIFKQAGSGGTLIGILKRKFRKIDKWSKYLNFFIYHIISTSSSASESSSNSFAGLCSMSERVKGSIHSPSFRFSIAIRSCSLLMFRWKKYITNIWSHHQNYLLVKTHHQLKNGLYVRNRQILLEHRMKMEIADCSWWRITFITIWQMNGIKDILWRRHNVLNGYTMKANWKPEKNRWKFTQTQAELLGMVNFNTMWLE